MAKQNFIGLVISQGKMSKTVKVRVQTKAYDTKVHKEVIKRKDYLVHDEGNLCKEGDIVRIQAIPKISARKYFAIADIKINKGQQFALYESLAKEKVAKEATEKIEQFLERRKEYENTIVQVEDLKTLDKLSNTFQSDPSADREFLLSEINAIKEKYNIKSWPSTEPVLKLEVNEAAKDLTILQNRVDNIKIILEKLMSEEYASHRQQILSDLSKTPVEELKPFTQKNILRKFILDPRNECPVTL
ncbi:DEHA2F05764p [Debaryomyces hansenii CBS767]|uniref:DEHA2F05764p n=1 Tax=Debaryomyces hansenii (strain ATCC 36239 / CBS 767 / BCRC 21394 / JCM 1990 / NBRC 0083 / IGC 2968) TaxID=284592 RepID=Q6BMF9_DEBHA|nr:mitochondrial 37S ribosomal protein MRPS17 [Debaryomyces hansenii CBS767]CAG88937.2 DEHA2F05764p [Debaryomyces hansenii CBS767]|eukprot:XP_460612.2 mitochondrial 37S ribosomal protein MRPS17 [Debaryomyces hansenii CBS767]